MTDKIDYDTLLANFDDLNRHIEQAKKEMRDKSEGLIEEAARRLFDATPEIAQVHWTQYTPYFNDGEACEFSVNDFCFATVEDVEEGDVSMYDSSTLYTQKDLKEARNDYREAAEFEDDPEKWRDEYRQRFINDYGREPWNISTREPYPSSRSDAQRRIDQIEKSLAKYPEGRADEVAANFEQFRDAMSKIPEDILQSVYGDHAAITITRKGTEVDEYDHD